MPSAQTADSSHLLAFIWSHRRRFAPGLTFAVARILTISPLPLIFRHIIDVQMKAGDARGILLMALLVVGLLVAHQWLSVLGAVRLGREVSDIVLELRADLFSKIQFLAFGYLDRQKTGRLLSKYAFDTQKVDAVMMPILNSFVPDTVFSLITMVILVAMNWQLALVVFLMLPVFAFMRARYFSRFQHQHEANRLAQEQLTGAASEIFTALRLVRSHGEEEKAEAQLGENTAAVARSRVQLIDVSSRFSAFSFGMIKALSLIVVAGGALLAIHSQITTGAVVAFVAGLPALLTPIQMFAQISDQYFLGQEAFRSARELLDAPYVEGWTGTRRSERLRGALAFDHVTFRYPGTERGAVREFSLTVEAGEKIALVGASGAGKSTLVNLLLGLYAPDTGEIRIDGVAQRDLDMRWFRRQAALVMQENFLLSGTIADNLRFGRADATEAEVIEAAELAQAMEFIRKMPEGLGTKVGERGATLSGGQRQRLAIARALLRNPALLILDEPTSALDYESEKLIQLALDRVSDGRTVVTIAHRLSTIRGADRIVVLREGRIVEMGDYATLVAQNGPFAQMVAAGTAGAVGA